ncbi:Transposase, partial [Phytophthora megakarya]
EGGHSVNAIAQRLERSWNVINNYLRNPDTYGTRKSSGRPRKLSPAAERRLLREASKTGASKTGVSARSLKEALQLPISVRRVQEVLHDSEHMVNQKRLACPPLNAGHIAARLEWANEHVEHGAKWNAVIFSDEKKFNLDGPDGYQYYWRDLRKEREIYSNRQSGGGSVFVWGAFSSKGKSDLAFLQGKQNAEKYIDTLGDYLFPFAHLYHGLEFQFQHDNASIHTAKVAKCYLKDQGVDVMWWPAKSPDLNPIENLWGMLARAVYENGKQYDTKEELVNAIKKAWEAIPLLKLKNLVASMKKRCMEVYRLEGLKTKY